MFLFPTFGFIAAQKKAWQSFRITLILVAAGIIIFLFATQQTLLSNLYTILISVGAIATVFARVSGLMGTRNSVPKQE